MGRQRLRRVGVRAVEHDPVSGERVDGGRLHLAVSVDRQVVGPQGIDRDEDHRCRFCGDGRAKQPPAAGDEQQQQRRNCAVEAEWREALAVGGRGRRGSSRPPGWPRTVTGRWRYSSGHDRVYADVRADTGRRAKLQLCLTLTANLEVRATPVLSCPVFCPAYLGASSAARTALSPNRWRASERRSAAPFLSPAAVERRQAAA